MTDQPRNWKGQFSKRRHREEDDHLSRRSPAKRARTAARPPGAEEDGQAGPSELRLAREPSPQSSDSSVLSDHDLSTDEDDHDAVRTVESTDEEGTGHEGQELGRTWAEIPSCLLPEGIPEEDSGRGLVVDEYLREWDKRKRNIVVDVRLKADGRHCGCVSSAPHLRRPRVLEEPAVVWAKVMEEEFVPVVAVFPDRFTAAELAPLDRVYDKTEALPWLNHRLNDNKPRFRHGQAPPEGVSRGNHGGIWMVRGAQYPYPQPTTYQGSHGECGNYLSLFEINRAYHESGIQAKVEASLYALSPSQYREGKDLFQDLHPALHSYLPPQSVFTTVTTALNSTVDCHKDPQDRGFVAQLVWGTHMDGGNLQFLDLNIEVVTRPGTLALFFAAALHHRGTPYRSGRRRLLSYHTQIPVHRAWTQHRDLWLLLKDDWAAPDHARPDRQHVIAVNNTAIGTKRPRAGGTDFTIYPEYG
jgi:hypothetical protein